MPQSLDPEIFYVYWFQIILSRWKQICICHVHVDNVCFSKSNKIKYFYVHLKPFSPLHLRAVLSYFSNFWHIGPTGRVSDLLYAWVLCMHYNILTNLLNSGDLLHLDPRTSWNRLSPATIYAGTLGTYCRRDIYIDAFFKTNGATIYALNFDTSCRRRQHMLLTLEQIVAKSLFTWKKSTHIMSMLSHSAYFDNGHKLFPLI